MQRNAPLQVMCLASNPLQMILYRSYPIITKLKAELVPKSNPFTDTGIKGSQNLKMFLPSTAPRQAYILQIRGPNIQTRPAIELTTTGRA